MDKNAKKNIPIEFEGKQGFMDILLKDIKEKKLPDLDEEFVKDLGDYKDIDDVKDKIKEELEKNSNHKTNHQLEDAIVAKLLELNQFDVPETLVLSQLHHLLNEASHSLRRQGLSDEDIKKEQEHLKENLKTRASDLVRLEFILAGIIEKEEIKAEKEEVDKKLEEIAKIYKKNPADIRKDMIEKGSIANIYNKIKDDKVIDLIIKEADITEKIYKEIAE